MVARWKTHSLYPARKRGLGPGNHHSERNRVSLPEKGGPERGHALFPVLGSRRGIDLLPEHDQHLSNQSGRRGARAVEDRESHSERRHERGRTNHGLARWKIFAAFHRYGRRTQPQRLGRTASRALDLRDRDAKSGPHNAENTLWLGRLLDRQ